MILLDTDHATILTYAGSPRAERLRARLAQVGNRVVAVSIVTVEERMRGWMASIAKERDVARQVHAYRELAALFGWFKPCSIWDREFSFCGGRIGSGDAARPPLHWGTPMIRVETAKWGQALDDLRHASVHAAHPRSRERFLALYLIAAGHFNATACAAHLGRQDETVLGWVHRYNERGPDALAYRRTGGRAPPFTPGEVAQVVEAVEATRPADHGLPGHGWTLKKLRQWVARTLGRVASRNTIRRLLARARLTWKKVKKLLGKAKPEGRAAHVRRLGGLFEGVRSGEVILVYVDEVHVHRDLDLGYAWGPRGQRLWRRSDCPGRSERMNAYGAYDFTNGECLLWDGGWCDGGRTVLFLGEVARWRAGKGGRVVLVWDNAPCHVAKAATAEAARLGIEVVNLPGYSPDLNPVERLWDWLREDVTRGFCHESVADLVAACQAFVARINRDPVALVDRLWPKFDLDPEFEEKLRVST